MPKVHVIVRIAVCLLFVFLPLQSMDEWFYDRFFRLRGVQEHSTPFVLIRVNNANLARSLERESFFYPREEPEPGTRAYTVWQHKFYDRW